MPKPSLSDVCATLDRALGSPLGAGALLHNKELVRELIRGVAMLDSRLSRLEAGNSHLAHAILRCYYAKDLHNIEQLEALAQGDFEAFDRLEVPQ